MSWCSLPLECDRHRTRPPFADRSLPAFNVERCGTIQGHGNEDIVRWEETMAGWVWVVIAVVSLVVAGFIVFSIDPDPR
jgi:hypothetical protein